MTYEERKALALAEIEAHHGEAVAINDALADEPEVSGQEYKSSARIVEYLRSQGWEVEYPFAGYDTAFKAVINGGNNHPRKIAILTEYDALEIGHACGHCVSAATSVLAGMTLAKLQDELNVDIHIMGTPIEETYGAKCTMVNDGIFDGYDMAMMVHMYNRNLTKTKLLAKDSYLYKFSGKAAHAASAPWEGNNALNGVTLMFHAMDMLRQHVRDDVRIHGVIRDGGMAPNIVPESASAEVYIRALDRSYLNEVIRKVDDCAFGAAMATQTTVEKIITGGAYDNLKDNKTGLAVLEEVFDELEIPLDRDFDEIFASTDAGNVSMVCPTFHPTLKIADLSVALHTKAFEELVKTDVAHKAIADGAKLIALQVIKIFGDETKFVGMKSDFVK